MQHTLNIADQIHQRALDAAGRYRRAEAELIDILQQAELHRVFLAKGHSSLFLYVVKELELSESVAYNLIVVSRKAREVPELKACIQAGAITISNAKRIVPVINRENQSEWIGKASTLSQRQLEKEIARVRPETATPERATYITEARLKLEVGLSEKEMMKLRRVQDLLSQSRQQAVSLEETLVSLTGDFLKRHDPLERAKRCRVKKAFAQVGMSKDVIENEVSANQTDPLKILVTRPVYAPNTRTKGANVKISKNYVREPIPATLLHQVNLRDERRCQFTNARDEKCAQTRWIEIHHKNPVSRGGRNALENLTTLCSAHHDWIHSSGD